MTDADKLREQKATSTDPAWLEREAKRAELLSSSPRKEQRTWALRARRASIRMGEFGKWRTHATYKSEEAAKTAADAMKLRWTGVGYKIETEVLQRQNGVYLRP